MSIKNPWGNVLFQCDFFRGDPVKEGIGGQNVLIGDVPRAFQELLKHTDGGLVLPLSPGDLGQMRLCAKPEGGTRIRLREHAYDRLARLFKLVGAQVDDGYGVEY